jgi:hypothetical protein
LAKKCSANIRDEQSIFSPEACSRHCKNFWDSKLVQITMENALPLPVKWGFEEIVGDCYYCSYHEEVAFDICSDD